MTRILKGILICAAIAGSIGLYAAPNKIMLEQQLENFQSQPAPGREVKIRDLTQVSGEEEIKLMGFGVVSGLNGTGDKKRAAIDLILRVAEKQGIRLKAGEIEKGNTAIVTISAEVSPHQREFNVAVKSIGDAKSLQNGFLEASTLSPIGSTDVFAVAQGPLSLGARYFEAAPAQGTVGGASSLTIGHPTMGYVMEGGELVREIDLQRVYNGSLDLFVKYPSNRTATNIANTINTYLSFQGVRAEPVSASKVKVHLPPELYQSQGTLTRLIADVGDLPARVSRKAVITVDQGSGVIAMTEGVKMEPGSIAVAGLTVTVTSNITPVVRQANNIFNVQSGESNNVGGAGSVNQQAPSGGATNFIDQPKLEVAEDQVNFLSLPAGTDLRKVQETFNALKLKPTSIISVFQAMHDAGMIHADIVVIPR